MLRRLEKVILSSAFIRSAQLTVQIIIDNLIFDNLNCSGKIIICQQFLLYRIPFGLGKHTEKILSEKLFVRRLDIHKCSSTSIQLLRSLAFNAPRDTVAQGFADPACLNSQSVYFQA